MSRTSSIAISSKYAQFNTAVTITVIRPLSAGNIIISLSFCRSLIAFCSSLSSLTGRLLWRLVVIWWRICSLVSSGKPNDETKEHIRHQITTNKRPVKLDNDEQKAIKDLQNDNEIIILPADKGRMTVIMNKSDYINKANTLIKDTETYQPLDTDPSKTSVNRINQKLKQLKDKDKLNETTYHRIRPNECNSTATTAKFYGLPKIHKENIPLRPIVSLPGSPTYELSKHLAMILHQQFLHPLVKTSTHTVNNANAFLTNIKDLKLEPDEIMISFDVVSLFTSIPLDTAKRITNELLTNHDSWQTRTNLDKDDILELLNLCLSTEFSFQNSYYRQISGTPMGSPLSSFLAEAVMQDLEKRSVTHNPDIRTWNRYVDDVLATVKKDKTDDILHCMNNTLENIQFTKEEQHNNQLAFLDVLLTRTNDGTINTQVYRKKTHTGQVLNFNSNHPTQHKISCIRTLFNQIDTHCNTQVVPLNSSLVILIMLWHPWLGTYLPTSRIPNTLSRSFKTFIFLAHINSSSPWMSNPCVLSFHIMMV